MCEHLLEGDRVCAVSAQTGQTPGTDTRLLTYQVQRFRPAHGVQSQEVNLESRVETRDCHFMKQNGF